MLKYLNLFNPKNLTHTSSTATFFFFFFLSRYSHWFTGLQQNFRQRRRNSPLVVAMFGWQLIKKKIKTGPTDILADTTDIRITKYWRYIGAISPKFSIPI
ncbi:hypothetical protein Hanom_Chr14g01287151 [Helianthus anomalus]